MKWKLWFLFYRRYRLREDNLPAMVGSTKSKCNIFVFALFYNSNYSNILLIKEGRCATNCPKYVQWPQSNGIWFLPCRKLESKCSWPGIQRPKLLSTFGSFIPKTSLSSHLLATEERGHGRFYFFLSFWLRKIYLVTSYSIG